MQTEQPTTHSVPYPLQDELAQGLLGRLARLNGLSSFNTVSKLLTEYSHRGNSIPQLWQLAEICRMDFFIFTANHSMLPILSPLTEKDCSFEEIHNRNQNILCNGLSIPKKQLRWCKTCSHLDIKKRGFSYWRRQHQINGVDWCIEHQHPLVCTSVESAIHSPGHTTTYGLEELNQTIITEETKYPAIQRLQNIMLGLLHRPIPIRFRAWSEAIANRISLRISISKEKILVSNLIREAFPATWLLRHFPDISGKDPKTRISGIDTAYMDIYRKHLSSLRCAAILAVLFDSAEHAMEALEAAESK
ncbi:TniQ family protein [Vogesella sp. LYT5W]|uniref:TniQ family protein n=1 Tax=Vogesella margarita TaxID=2984199 RepID=A0ABT5IPC2_9NEIS|nr:TniQ family protein [Vogesella margarita]MDC7714421.1 TniQ family protein [Vogesella margarita]